jgi:hypothetical protein
MEGLPPGAERPWRVPDRWSISDAVIKNEWSYTYHPQYALLALCIVKHRDNFTFTLLASVRTFFPFVFGFSSFIFCAFVFAYLSCLCFFFFRFKLRYFLCLIHLFLSLHCLRFSLSVLPPSRTFLFFRVFTRTSVLRDQEGCIRYRGTSDRVVQIIRTVLVATDRGGCMISTNQTTESGISFQKIMCDQTVWPT